MEYIQHVCSECGFVTKCDKLRIPSTKRCCIVSYGRACKLSNEKFIQSKCSIGDFRARETVEKVRNCTQLDKNLVENIVKLIYQRLLDECDQAEQNWNAGGSVTIKEIAECLPQDALKELKKECGGLQTLVKNRRYIFELIGEVVRLRKPATCESTGGKYKAKPCWFFRNHINGCVNSDLDCAYKHESSNFNKLLP